MTEASLLGLIPTGGVAGVLVLVIIYFMRQNHGDRQQYREHMTRTEAEHAEEIRAISDRHTEQIKAIESRHAEQMAYVRGELAALNEKVTTTLAELDDERRRRWHAEDAAAKARRDLAALEGTTHA